MIPSVLEESSFHVPRNGCLVIIFVTCLYIMATIVRCLECIILSCAEL